MYTINIIFKLYREIAKRERERERKNRYDFSIIHLD